MVIYIILSTYTEQGARDVKDSPKRLNAAKALARRLNGRFRQFFLTMGAYDIVAIAEFPNDEAAAKFALTLASKGNVRTTTLKAFSEADYRKIVRALPRG